MSRHRYPIEASRVFERTGITKLQTALTCSKVSKSNDSFEVDEGGNNHSNDTSKDQCTSKIGKSNSNKNANDGGQAMKATLKIVLGEVLGYGPALSEHIILDAGLAPNMKVGDGSGIDVAEVLVQAVARFEDWLVDVISGEKVPEGYILMQNKASGKKNIILSLEGISDQVP